MINTILLDLDGTLLRFKQSEFIEAYFKRLGKAFADIELDAEKSIKAVWSGTKAMIVGGGNGTNDERFWKTFAEVMELSDEEVKTVEARCDEFYKKDFDEVKSVLAEGSTDPNNISKQIVHEMANKGYELVLATNPLFPECAVKTRLNWIGLKPENFSLITHYSNSMFCKPNLGYYNEILSKINKQPEQCLMVGNNPAEDMCVSELGMDVFLINEYVENEAGLDISEFKQGKLEQFYEWQKNMSL